jgi:hypothetical protein
MSSTGRVSNDNIQLYEEIKKEDEEIKIEKKKELSESNDNTSSLSLRIKRLDGSDPHDLKVKLYGTEKTTICGFINSSNTILIAESKITDVKENETNVTFTYPTKYNRLTNIYVTVFSPTTGFYKGTKEIEYDTQAIKDLILKPSKKENLVLDKEKAIKMDIFEYSPKDAKNRYQPANINHIPKEINDKTEHNIIETILKEGVEKIPETLESLVEQDPNKLQKNLGSSQSIPLCSKSLVKMIFEFFGPKALIKGENGTLELNIDFSKFEMDESKDAPNMPKQGKVTFNPIYNDEKEIDDLEIIEIGVAYKDQKMMFCKNPESLDKKEQLNKEEEKKEEITIEDENKEKKTIETEQELFNTKLREMANMLQFATQSGPHLGTHLLVAQYAMALFRNFVEDSWLTELLLPFTGCKSAFEINLLGDPLIFSKNLISALGIAPFTPEGLKQVEKNAIASHNYNWRPTKPRFKNDILKNLQNLLYDSLYEGISAVVKKNLNEKENIKGFEKSKQKIYKFSEDLHNNSYDFEYYAGYDKEIIKNLDDDSEINIGKEGSPSMEKIMKDAKTLDEEAIERFIRAIVDYAFLNLDHDIVHKLQEPWRSLHRP